ncbi:MAG: phosphopantothenoylcysteine decarboxylase [Bacteroidetes bacterium GWF2_49_14]|nr:MAG: phosphopantothenoylcysteine decarboxylase [Bacteroidetes bacterium GWF2_49_14]HBB93635.1 bifunctional phosphopantothenoylcysteine decarboxylase/phosphopantothenate--cysteine ligase CoaBC [Bacteroidales bacterium]
MLRGKKFILGVTGSIAAYKSAYLTRLLRKEGAEVKVILTPYAQEFITPVTLGTLSNNTVLTDFFRHDDGSWNSHVELGLWADLMLIAPATANTLAKMAHGICDNLLLTTYLSARCPVVIAPAMDLDMFAHPATRENMRLLQSRGNLIIEPATGELASGLEGKGRMEEPEIILSWLQDYYKKKSRFSGKRALITAGPTHERIDPVRFIGNHSSGKMGYALAEVLASEGARVDLVSGPVSIKSVHPDIKVHSVETASEMAAVVDLLQPDMNILIFAAAVADYSPVAPAQNKIKRTGENLSLALAPTTDIAAAAGKKRLPGQFLAGFALETDNGFVNAGNKLLAKNLDMIVLNTLGDPGAGFNVETNQITIISKDNNRLDFELKPKREVATDIADAIYKLMNDGTQA